MRSAGIGFLKIVFGVVVASLLLPAGFVESGELKVGDPAPAFELAGSDGTTHRLVDYRGEVVVLAWFPKAFTGG